VRLTEELSKRDWLQCFIHIGSLEIYGPCEFPVSELAPLNPTSPYAISKAAFALHLVSIHKHLKFLMNILRPSNAYGPGQQLYRLIPKAVLCGLSGRTLPLHGGGLAEKSYIHARDLAAAIHVVAQKSPARRNL
jgi:dTDP-glucose 4,6-dehydratase